MTHRTADELAAGLAHVDAAPKQGRLELVVVRPATDERRVLDACELDPVVGATGDRWSSRYPAPTSKDLESQLTLTSARVLALVGGPRERWPLSGDQLVVDLDLSKDHLAPGDLLRVGPVLLEITPKPHNGCSKYAARFGAEALAWLEAPENERRRLRGIYARVLEGGTVRTGDLLEKLPSSRKG